MSIAYVTSALLGRQSNYNQALQEVERDITNPRIQLNDFIFLARAAVYLQLVQKPEVTNHPLFIRQVREFVRARPPPVQTGPIPDQLKIDAELLSVASTLQNFVDGHYTQGNFDLAVAETERVVRLGQMEQLERRLLVETQTYLSLIRDTRLRAALSTEITQLVDDVVAYLGGIEMDRRRQLDEIIATHPDYNYILPYHL